jgi:hypothetical protein
MREIICKLWIIGLLLPVFNLNGQFSKVFTLQKEIILETNGLEIGMLYDLAADAYNNLIFLDSKTRQVLLFDQNGKYIKKIGSIGQGPGEYQAPSALHVDRKGRIYISDHNTRRINIYDPSGKYGSSFIASSQHWQPVKIRTDGKNGIYLCGLKPDKTNKKPGVWINKYNTEGQYVHSFFEQNKHQPWVRNITFPDFDIREDQIFAVKPDKYEISIFDLNGEMSRKIKKSPDYFKPLDPNISFNMNNYKSVSELRKKLNEMSKLWTRIINIRFINDEYYLLNMAANDLVEGVDSEYIIDILDKKGNLIVEKVPTNYKFLHTDYESRLYFLTYTNEEEALDKELVYKIGIFKLKELEK